MHFGAYTHDHVSEREPRNQPEDPHDPAGWEDCTWTSGLELARAVGQPVPATLAEAEALREASGEPPGGGSNIGDLRRGMLERYGWAGAVMPYAQALALKVGEVAVVTGTMSELPDHYRRWDPPFGGAHAAAIFQLDAEDRVWWCDPLAPEGDYEGEWMARAILRLFLGNGPTMVARMNSRRVQPAQVVVTAGPWYELAVRDGVVIRMVNRATGGFSAQVTERVKLPVQGAPGVYRWGSQILRRLDGSPSAYGGRWIYTAGPDNVLYSPGRKA